MAMAMTLVLAACGNDKDYEHLKTDIVGFWCDVDGPEYVQTESGGYYRLYEFTKTGGLYYHEPNGSLSVWYPASYEITDDILNVDGARCRITIENDILTMAYDSGESKYRRMTVEEVCSYGVYAQDADFFSQQEPYLESMTGDTAADTE